MSLTLNFNDCRVVTEKHLVILSQGLIIWSHWKDFIIDQIKQNIYIYIYIKREREREREREKWFFTT
jgi:hypothetical protein